MLTMTTFHTITKKLHIENIAASLLFHIETPRKALADRLIHHHSHHLQISIIQLY